MGWRETHNPATWRRRMSLASQGPSSRTTRRCLGHSSLSQAPADGSTEGKKHKKQSSPLFTLVNFLKGSHGCLHAGVARPIAGLSSTVDEAKMAEVIPNPSLTLPRPLQGQLRCGVLLALERRWRRPERSSGDVAQNLSARSRGAGGGHRGQISLPCSEARGSSHDTHPGLHPSRAHTIQPLV